MMVNWYCPECKTTLRRDADFDGKSYCDCAQKDVVLSRENTELDSELIKEKAGDINFE